MSICSMLQDRGADRQTDMTKLIAAISRTRLKPTTCKNSDGLAYQLYVSLSVVVIACSLNIDIDVDMRVCSNSR